jgi:hypothetical protein
LLRCSTRIARLSNKTCLCFIHPKIAAGKKRSLGTSAGTSPPHPSRVEAGSKLTQELPPKLAANLTAQPLNVSKHLTATKKTMLAPAAPRAGVARAAAQRSVRVSAFKPFSTQGLVAAVTAGSLLLVGWVG